MSSLAPSEMRRSRRAAASLRTSARISFACGGGDLADAGLEHLAQGVGLVSPPVARRMSDKCARTLLAAIANSSTRTISGSGVSSISRPQLGQVEQALDDQECR